MIETLLLLGLYFFVGYVRGAIRQTQYDHKEFAKLTTTKPKKQKPQTKVTEVKAPEDNKYIYKARNGKYRVYIRTKDIYCHYGLFDTKELARAKRDEILSTNTKVAQGAEGLCKLGKVILSKKSLEKCKK